MAPPKTQYAEKAGIKIAYQAFGEGPLDLVIANGIVANMDLIWNVPQGEAMLRRLGTFARVILFDKPGTGLSDPIVGAPTPEQRMEDIRAVMDAADSEVAAILGYSEGGMAAAMFAATYPERTQALILLCTLAKATRAADYLPDVEAVDRLVADFETAVENWGEGYLATKVAPSWSRAPLFRHFSALAERASASPGMARAIFEAIREFDVRPALPAITAPTLVLHRDAEWVPVETAHDLAERIAGAKLVVLPGDDHVFWAGDWRAIADEVQEFLTGEHDRPDPDRELKTLLFTDIVGSTELAAEVGDAPWRALLTRHEELIATQVGHHGGRVVKMLGDGGFAAFDRPAKAVRCAQSIVHAAEALNLEIRAGIHTGECEIMGDDLGGLAVHIAARVAATAAPSEVLVSGTVRDLVLGSGLTFAARGAKPLKGVPGEWQLYALEDDHARDARSIERAPERAGRTPGALQAMSPADRMTMSLWKRSPALSRAAMRMLARRERRRPAA